MTLDEVKTVAAIVGPMFTLLSLSVAVFNLLFPSPRSFAADLYNSEPDLRSYIDDIGRKPDLRSNLVTVLDKIEKVSQQYLGSNLSLEMFVRIVLISYCYLFVAIVFSWALSSSIGFNFTRSSSVINMPAFLPLFDSQVDPTYTRFLFGLIVLSLFLYGLFGVTRTARAVAARCGVESLVKRKSPRLADFLELHHSESSGGPSLLTMLLGICLILILSVILAAADLWLSPYWTKFYFMRAPFGYPMESGRIFSYMAGGAVGFMSLGYLIYFFIRYPDPRILALAVAFAAGGYFLYSREFYTHLVVAFLLLPLINGGASFMSVAFTRFSLSRTVRDLDGKSVLRSIGMVYVDIVFTVILGFAILFLLYWTSLFSIQFSPSGNYSYGALVKAVRDLDVGALVFIFALMGSLFVPTIFHVSASVALSFYLAAPKKERIMEIAGRRLAGTVSVLDRERFARELVKGRFRLVVGSLVAFTVASTVLLLVLVVLVPNTLLAYRYLFE